MMLVVAVTNPINSMLSRVGMLLAYALAWSVTMWLCRKKKPLQLAVAVLPIAILIPFFLPGRAMDVARLQTDYLANLRSTNGAIYVWGAESARAVDCSGLPRLALRRAFLSQGLTTLNGGATRTYLYHWWNDASAKALGEGHLGYTIPLKTIGRIREMSYSELEPGDLAVTSSGAHILVYLGGEEWIQADPGVGHVAIFNGRRDKNPWFTSPVTTHRWAVFARP